MLHGVATSHCGCWLQQQPLWVLSAAPSNASRLICFETSTVCHQRLGVEESWQGLEAFDGIMVRSRAAILCRLHQLSDLVH